MPRSTWILLLGVFLAACGGRPEYEEPDSCSPPAGFHEGFFGDQTAWATVAEARDVHRAILLPDGRTVLAGIFLGSVVFDEGLSSEQSATFGGGREVLFIAWLRPDGTIDDLQTWTSVQYSGRATGISGLAADEEGNIYLSVGVTGELTALGLTEAQHHYRSQFPGEVIVSYGRDTSFRWALAPEFPEPDTHPDAVAVSSFGTISMHGEGLRIRGTIRPPSGAADTTRRVRIGEHVLRSEGRAPFHLDVSRDGEILNAEVVETRQAIHLPVGDDTIYLESEGDQSTLSREGPSGELLWSIPAYLGESHSVRVYTDDQDRVIVVGSPGSDQLYFPDIGTTLEFPRETGLFVAAFDGPELLWATRLVTDEHAQAHVEAGAVAADHSALIAFAVTRFHQTEGVIYARVSPDGEFESFRLLRPERLRDVTVRAIVPYPDSSYLVVGNFSGEITAGCGEENEQVLEGHDSASRTFMIRAEY